MRKLLIGIGSALLITGLLAGAAAAAPSEQNPKAEILAVDCGDGATTVVTVENASSAFLPDGRVAVAKRISADTTGTITTFDGQVIPFDDFFEEGSRGSGFEGRLVECSFAETFSETFVLDEAFAEALGIPEYAGTEVTLEADVDGTAWVLLPGR